MDMSKKDKVYCLILAVFCTVLVLTNIIGVKLFHMLPHSLGKVCWGNPASPEGTYCTLTSGIITYPLTFLLTDTVSELYGRKRADFMVAIGFVVSLVMVLFVAAAVALPGSSIWTSSTLGFSTVACQAVDAETGACLVPGMQQGYESVFTLPGTLVLGSMTAYLFAQFLDNRLFHYWRNKTQGRHLWLRNNASTIVSQLVDTLIVNIIFLWWGLGLPIEICFQILIANYVFKVLIAALDTPLVYLLTSFLRKHLNLPPAEAEYQTP
ncbi:MAG: hypothetical protein CMH55_06030 [Myxococcales bacterium]|nr:hypothetical protein [Myxococcales bacterium]